MEGGSIQVQDDGDNKEDKEDTQSSNDAKDSSLHSERMLMSRVSLKEGFNLVLMLKIQSTIYSYLLPALTFD
jgi:hypothetical protein